MNNSNVNPIFYGVRTNKGELLYNFHASLRGEKKTPTLRDTHLYMASTLDLVESGGGTLYIGERGLPINAGDLILLRCNEPRYLDIDSTKGPMFITDISFQVPSVIFLASEWVDYRLLNVLISDDEFCNVLKKDNPYVKEIVRTMLELKEEFSKELPNISVAKTKFLTILARIMDYAGYKTPVNSALNSRNVNIVWSSVEYIRNNLTEDINVKTLADRANMDESHFSRVFKSILGFSPWKYIIHSRIGLAMNYLKETNPHYSVTEVASMTGFSNLSNFNRIFKNITGMTPSQFRKLK